MCSAQTAADMMSEEPTGMAVRVWLSAIPQDSARHVHTPTTTPRERQGD